MTEENSENRSHGNDSVKGSKRHWWWPVLIFFGFLVFLYAVYDFNDVKPVIVNSSTQQIVNVNKTFEFPRPEIFPRGTAERCLAEYLYAWHKQNYKKMADHTNFTWRSNESNPAEKIYALFSAYKPLTYEILYISKTSDVTAIPGVRDITVKIVYDLAGRTKEVTGTVRVIQESAPHDISEFGRWGVNPISALQFM